MKEHTFLDPSCPRCSKLRAAAQAGEAGTAETVKQGSVNEHAVGEPDAPKGG
jgi:hypothetical protein